jgi:hypothetical protein
LSPHRHDEKTYISNSKEQILMQEQLLSYDRQTDHSLYDHAWDTAQLSCAISTPEE